jgi:large subunit ribosomal protein L22
MSSITVKNNYVKKSASKVRQVCNLIRNKKVEDALRILRFCEKKDVAIMLSKLINSGLAIATDSKKYDLDNLVIGSIMVDEGPSLKRIMPRAQGRAYRIRKRTSYVTVSLKEK